MTMRVLMLGWEFPPFITGGLGTACAGLTKSLVNAGTEVTFVLPKSVGPDSASHVRLVTPRGITEPLQNTVAATSASAALSTIALPSARQPQAITPSASFAAEAAVNTSRRGFVRIG